ncbi:MAG: isopeptide-forming domain-containing fimbrial protein [Oscillospiraceae bacterium]|nr:isopeptide-forming domain-containing fimbrial protein [Oscillospiraceae bacterium]
MKNFKRVFAAFMALTILFSLTLGVSAATVDNATIDTTRTGSIEIYKYDLTMANTNDAVAAMLESYVSTGVKDEALEAVMDDGTVNDLGNGQQSYGYAIKGVEFSYLKVADIVTYSETEADGVHRDLVLYKFDDSKDAALLSALGLTNNDAYPVVASYAETGYHFFTSDTLIDALAAALASNSTAVKNALENYMAAQNAGKFDETDAHGYTSKDELPLGLYLIVETKVPEMVTSTCNPFFVSLPMTSVNGTNATNGGEEWLYDVTLYPKNETGIPTLEKTVREDKDDTGKNDGSDAIDDGYEHNATASTGDKLDYQFTDRLPAITSNTTALTVWGWLDTLSKGLEYNGSEAAENAGLLNGHYNPNDVEIHFYRDAAMTDKITDWKLTDATPKFTVTYGTGENGATTMIVAVNAAGLNEMNTATTVYTAAGAVERGYSRCYVRVTYSATLNQNADVVFGDDGNPNTVVLTWQRSNMNYYDTLVDDTHVYTYVLELVKEFSDRLGDFTKVKFKAQNTTDGYWLVARQDSDGVYYVTGHVADEADATTFIPNSSTGVLTIKGVEDDTYVLTEIQTDNGYTLLKDDITVVITAEEDENRPCGIYDTDVLGLVQNDERYETFEGYQELEHNMLTASATVDGKDVNMQAVEGSANALVPLKVINTRGYTPPKTGDNGNWMYGVIAAMLAAAAISALFLAFRKRKATDEQ